MTLSAALHSSALLLWAVVPNDGHWRSHTDFLPVLERKRLRPWKKLVFLRISSVKRRTTFNLQTESNLNTKNKTNQTLSALFYGCEITGTGNTVGKQWQCLGKAVSNVSFWQRNRPWLSYITMEFVYRLLSMKWLSRIELHPEILLITSTFNIRRGKSNLLPVCQ